MITQEYLKECLSYDPETGLFTWLPDRPESHFSHKCGYAIWLKNHAGKKAGCLNGKGYYHIGILGKRYPSHRLAWVIVHGCWPDQIDHINGDRKDNRLCNLRAVDVTENQKNASVRLDNKTGVTGVGLHSSGKYHAYIRHNGRHKHIGLFDTLESAALARKQAEKEYGYHKNHGRQK